VAAAADNGRRPETGSPDGYRRLTGVLRSLVGEQSADAVLARVATALRQLIPCADVVVWELVDGERLAPTLIDGEDEEELRGLTIGIGEGITGGAVLDQQLIACADAHTDPRAAVVPGTAAEPEAILCVPLTARGTRLGALSLYRRGCDRAFADAEIELVQQFADVAAIALHNAHTLAEFQRLALTDDLTGLANRRGFREELERQTAAAERHGTPISLLLLDIDEFKEINDRHGHGAGDGILREIAMALRHRVRVSDLPARIGGDEFAVLLPHTTDAEAQTVADDLMCHLREGRATSLPLRVSIGVASCIETLDEALFADADRALYAAKGRRKGGRTAARR
jgi:diguanylate cyclase (GGDEF)-like protein